MTNIQDLIRSSVRRDPNTQPIVLRASAIPAPIIRGGTDSLKLRLKGDSLTQLIHASTKRAPSVQPGMPKIATSSTTARTLSAPIAPTAIGRLSSVIKTDPMQSSYAKTLGISPSAQISASSSTSGFTPIPSALAAPLGGGVLATTSSPGGLGGIVDTVKSYIPLAIKIVLAVIVFKIVLWLIRGRRR